MATVLYVLMVWFLASVPFALFIGWLCSLNQLSLDGGFAHVARVEAPGRPQEGANRHQAAGAAQSNTHSVAA